MLYRLLPSFSLGITFIGIFDVLIVITDKNDVDRNKIINETCLLIKFL